MDRDIVIVERNTSFSEENHKATTYSHSILLCAFNLVIEDKRNYMVMFSQSFLPCSVELLH